MQLLNVYDMSASNVIWIDDLSKASDSLTVSPLDSEHAVCFNRTHESHITTVAIAVQPLAIRCIPQVKYKRVRCLTTRCCIDAPDAEIQDICTILFKPGSWVYDEVYVNIIHAGLG